MTQHPFERKFSQREIAKLNIIDRHTNIEELTKEETKQIFGGGCDHFTRGTKSHSDLKKVDLPIATTNAIGEEGGGPY